MTFSRSNVNSTGMQIPPTAGGPCIPFPVPCLMDGTAYPPPLVGSSCYDGANGSTSSTTAPPVASGYNPHTGYPPTYVPNNGHTGTNGHSPDVKSRSVIGGADHGRSGHHGQISTTHVGHAEEYEMSSKCCIIM